MRLAAGRLLARPWPIWTVAGIFAFRDVLLNIFVGDRPDARNWWLAGRAFLSDPGGLYPLTAQLVAQNGLVIPGQAGFLGPPLQVVIAAPFALIPEPTAVAIWTLIDGLCLLGALLVLYRVVRPEHPATRALYWLVAAYFPPLFAEVNAGQRGGLILILALAAFALEERPLLAGLAGGLSASLKFYSLALVLAGRVRFGLALAVSFTLSLALSFIPFGDPRIYVMGVLLPAATVSTPDCAITSVASLWQRTVGGKPYALPGPSGLVSLQTPVHLPVLATLLTVLTLAAVVAGAVWAARRSGWNPHYGMLLGLALGALVPSEVYPYQWLPLLPLALAVAVRAADARAWLTLALVGVALLGFVRQPCELPFPNLWTLAGLAAFAVGVWHHEFFRSDSSALSGGGEG